MWDLCCSTQDLFNGGRQNLHCSVWDIYSCGIWDLFAAWGIFSCGICDLLILVRGIFIVAHGIFVTLYGILVVACKSPTREEIHGKLSLVT